MPEAITKYAINSTLGTDDFQPLDEIVTQGFNQQFTIVASDEVYVPLENLSVYVHLGTTVTETHPQKFRMLRSGELIFKGYYSTSAHIDDPRLKIYKNGVAATIKSSIAKDPVSFSYRFNFQPNDEIYFELSGSNDSAPSVEGIFIKDASLCGTIRPTIYEII